MKNTEYESSFAAFLEKLNFKGKAMDDLFTTNKAGMMDIAMLGALMGGFLARSAKQKATITVQITKSADTEEENDFSADDEQDVSGNDELKHLRDRFILELAEKGMTPLQISQILRVRLRFINNLLRKQKAGEAH